MSRDDYTGYKRPPVKRRFKPGQSGNPKGRPKGSKNFKTLLSEMLERKITVRVGDKRKRITQAEAILQILFNRAMSADPKALTTIVSVMRSLGIGDPNAPEPGTYGTIILPAVMTPEDWDREAGKHQAPHAGNEKNLT